MAGLKRFIPRPPKTILPMPMATTAPIHPTYHGAVAGKDSPRIVPVTTAERSFRHRGRALMRVKIASETSEAATQISSCLTANHRK